MFTKRQNYIILPRSSSKTEFLIKLKAENGRQKLGTTTALELGLEDDNIMFAETDDEMAYMVATDGRCTLCT